MEVTDEVLRQMKKGKRKTMAQEANKTLDEIKRQKRQKYKMKVQLREKATITTPDSDESSSEAEDATKMDTDNEDAMSDSAWSTDDDIPFTQAGSRL